jgi:DNA-binding transcriptional LysR family regulator
MRSAARFEQWLAIELRHLTALQTIAGEGSFKRAATRLGYTQPAISQQLARLEGIVGRRLVNRPRAGETLSLTDAGTLLLKHVGPVQAHLAAAYAELAALEDGRPAPLRVGTYQSVAATLLPHVLRRAAGPGAPEVLVTEAQGDYTLLRHLERGELDLAFLELPLPEEAPVAAEPLLADDYVLLARKDSPVAALGQPVPPTALVDLPLLTFRESRSTEQVIAQLRGQGITPRVIFRTDDNWILQRAVASGLGVGLLPRLATAGHAGDLVVRELGGGLPARIVALAWHAERPPEGAAAAFADVARRLSRVRDASEDRRSAAC